VQNLGETWCVTEQHNQTQVLKHEPAHYYAKPCRIKICASGVPIGNGELSKSQFSCSWPAAKDIIYWPMANYVLATNSYLIEI
jgi:hypothetical protein